MNPTRVTELTALTPPHRINTTIDSIQLPKFTGLTCYMIRTQNSELIRCNEIIMISKYATPKNLDLNLLEKKIYIGIFSILIVLEVYQ